MILALQLELSREGESRSRTDQWSCPRTAILHPTGLPKELANRSQFYCNIVSDSFYDYNRVLAKSSTRSPSSKASGLRAIGRAAGAVDLSAPSSDFTSETASDACSCGCLRTSIRRNSCLPSINTSCRGADSVCAA